MRAKSLEGLDRAAARKILGAFQAFGVGGSGLLQNLLPSESGGRRFWSKVSELPKRDITNLVQLCWKKEGPFGAI